MTPPGLEGSDAVSVSDGECTFVTEGTTESADGDGGAMSVSGAVSPKTCDNCDKAVTLSGRPSMRTGRGVARALTGDIEGAIEDLEAYASPGERWIPPDRKRAQRLEWIAALRRGENPFTPAWLRTRRERSADSR